MPRRRASSSRRKSSVPEPASKKMKISVISETKCDVGTDSCLSDAKTLPNDACDELRSPNCIHVDDLEDNGIPLITIDDSDSSSTSEPKVSFTEHAKENCKIFEAPSNRCLGAERFVSSHMGSLRDGRKSSVESEVSGPCFEMLFSEENVKKELPDNMCSSEDVSILHDIPFNQPSKFSVEVEKLCTPGCNDECHASMKSGASDSLLVSDGSRVSSSKIRSTSGPIMSITPHIKVERIECLSNIKLGTTAKPVVDTNDSTLTNGRLCEVCENPRSETSISFSGNQNDACNLLAKQGRNNHSQYSYKGVDGINTELNLQHKQILKYTELKSEPSEDQSNSSTVSNSICSRLEGENVIKCQHLCNITYKLENIPQRLLHNLSDSQGLPKNMLEKASLEMDCYPSANTAFENQKSVGNDSTVLCNESSSSARGSPFDLSILSLNPTEQKAAEVVGCLPQEKLQVLIREYIERRCLELEPIFQELRKDPSKQCSKADCTYLAESKHAGATVPHINTNIRNCFHENKKGESLADTVNILCGSWKQGFKGLISSSLIKTETPESLGLDLTCSTEAVEQNLNVSSRCCVDCNENNKSDKNCTAFVDIKCIPSRSTESNCGVLQSVIDRMQVYFASNTSCCPVSTSLCHAAKENSELVSENQNLPMTKASPCLKACRDNNKGNVMGAHGSLCETSHAVGTNLSGSTNSGSVQLVPCSQQNLLVKNVPKGKKCQNLGNETMDDCISGEMGCTIKCGFSRNSYSENSAELVSQSQQTLLGKDISNMENSNKKHQNPDNLMQKHNTKTTKVSDEKNILNSELPNCPSDFHSAVTESHCNEMQVKKGLEEGSLINVKSVFGSEGGVRSESINVNKLLSLETLRAIVDAVSHSSDNPFVPGSDISVPSSSKQNSFSTKLVDTAITTVKKESEYSDNLLAADILSVIAQSFDTSVLTSTKLCYVGNEHHNEDSFHFEKSEFSSRPLDLCKKEQGVTEIPESMECDKMCGKQLSGEPCVSESGKQNLSTAESTVKMMQSVLSTTENVSIASGMEGNVATCVTQNCKFSKNGSLGSDDVENSSFGSGKKENANLHGILFNVSREENLGNNVNSNMYQSSDFKGESSCDEKDFTCINVGDDAVMRKKCKHISSDVSEKCESAMNEDIPQSENSPDIGDYCKTHTKSSGEKSENLIEREENSLSCKEKENTDSVVSKKSVDWTAKSDCEPGTSLEKYSHVLVTENVRHVNDGKTCVPSECSQSEATEKGGLYGVTLEPETEISSHPKLKLQESSTCVTNNSVCIIPFSTKGSNKIQRFASRASLLTNEMLDGGSKIAHKQQKVLEGKKNEQAVDFNCDESHLLVKTPELNINACDKDFGITGEHSTINVFGMDPRKQTETVVGDLTRPSASDAEDQRQKIETSVNREQNMSSVFSNDPTRKIEVLVSSGVTSNKDDSSSLKKAGIDLNANIISSKEYGKFHAFAESQKHTQFPPVAGNQHNQNMYETSSYWNYSNYMHSNRYPGAECFRTPRYPSSPYQASTSPWFPYYTNASLPYQPSMQFFSPHARFGFPPQDYQGIPNRPLFSGEVQRYEPPLRALYPSQNSFPNVHSSLLPSCYPSQRSLSPVCLDLVPVQSTAGPVFHPVSSENFLPSAASPLGTSTLVSLHTNRTSPTGAEPVHSEHFSSTVSKSSFGGSRCKVTKIPQRMHSSEESASPSLSSPFDDFVSENAVLSPKAVAPETESKKSSSVSHSHAPKNLKSSVITHDKGKSKLPSKDFLNSVLAWSVNWLSQQPEMSKPPPVTDNIKKTESTYKCYDEYYSTYFPFLLLETWEIIFQAWKRKRILHRCFLKQYKDYDKRIYEVHIETVVSSADFSSGKYPSEGHLVTLKFGLETTSETKVYGYISSHSSRPFSSSVNLNHLCYKGYSSKPVEGDIVLSLVVKTSFEDESINCKVWISLCVIHFLKPVVRQFDALLKLKTSPLCGALVSPEQTNCKLISLSRGKFIKPNDINTDAVTEIIYAILPSNPPQVVVVEAAPGTNKINTYVNIIKVVKSIDAFTHKVKFLFCSKSSEFLDDVGCSLVCSKEGSEEKNKLHCVRIGKLSDIHPDMRNLSLHSLVENYVETLRECKLKECEEEISEHQKELNNRLASVSTLKKCSPALASQLKKTIPDMERKLLEKLRKKTTLSKRNTLLKQYEKEAQRKILKNSDVTLTTLRDYHQLEVLYSSGEKTFIPFSCCIIDCADQCSELETLPPLLSDIEKLVLCGDPDVAPVVLSKLIEKNDPYRSCFRRIRLINRDDESRKGRKSI